MKTQEVIKELNKLKTGAPCSDVDRRDRAIEIAKEALTEKITESKVCSVTNREVLNRFKSSYPEMVSAIDDYRPLGYFSDPQRVGITVYLKNGDVILYFPKIQQGGESE